MRKINNSNDTLEKLNVNEFNKVKEQLVQLEKNTPCGFHETTHLSSIKPLSLGASNHFQIRTISYTLKNNAFFLDFPFFDREHIYQSKIYKPTRFLFLLEGVLVNSVFFCKFKNNKKIETKVNNLLTLNVSDFSAPLAQKPYFYNKNAASNWALQTKKKQNIIMLIEYSYKENVVINNIVPQESEFYFINLKKDIERRQNIETNYHYLNPVRIDAYACPMGHVGLLKTNYHLLNTLLNNKSLDKCPVIMEDDCLLLDKQDVFLERWAGYKTFLVENYDKMNYFSGGCIYIKPLKIVNKDPCIVECSYGLCTQFIVHGDTSSKNVINYINDGALKLGIDRVLCDQDHTFWVPYPFLCIQRSKETNICKRLKQHDYLNILQTEFANSQKILKDFVEGNINV